MKSLLDSEKINQLVNFLQTCVISIPMNEKQKLAEAALFAITKFSVICNNELKAEFVAVPDLLTSLAILCGEETLLRNSDQIKKDISRSAHYLSIYL
mmetsp:Transcript_2551/g.3541  ORF Transcript_2551/g.3541 Transcript_2551/m.3541 type:complete len:97 (+) Transcript_2551:413-703(+)